VRLSRRHDDAEGDSVPTTNQVQLGPESTPGSPEGVVCGLVVSVFLGAPAAAFEALMLLPSTHQVSQSISPSRAERAWAIEQAARCGAVGMVVGDGAGLAMAESRRLQLAAPVGPRCSVRG